MKKVGFTIEFGRKEEKPKHSEKFENGIEALARMADRCLTEAVRNTELDFNTYIDALYEVSEFADDGDYEMAIEMMYLIALILDQDVKTVIEEVIYPDRAATEIFLDYFNWYIADGYVIERSIQRSCKSDCNGNKTEDKDGLDEEYHCLKEMMKSRSKNNENE